MARARRVACIPRLRVPITARDLALNRSEVLRIVTAGNCDFASARLMLWAMDLTAAALPAERASRLQPTHNPNISYHVPVNPLFARSCIENPPQVPENTWGAGEGVSPPARLGNPTVKRVRFPQHAKPAGRNLCKPWA